MGAFGSTAAVNLENKEAGNCHSNAAMPGSARVVFIWELSPFEMLRMWFTGEVAELFSLRFEGVLRNDRLFRFTMAEFGAEMAVDESAFYG